MKYLLSCILMACMLAPAMGQNLDTENYERKRNVIKLSPWQLLGGIFEVGYERSFNEGKSSLQLMPAVTLRQNTSFDDRFREIWGIEGMSQYRFYYQGDRTPSKPLYKSAQGRLYTAPYYRLKSMNAQYTEPFFSDFEFSDGNGRFEDESLSHEAGFVAGVQVLAWDRFSFDFYLGGGWRYSQLVSNNPFETEIRDDNITNPAYTGVVPRINFQMGIAF